MMPIASPIAVVGMDCRFPSAADIDELWRLLMDGTVAKSVVPAARWDIDHFHSPQLRPGTMNTRYAHFIDDADLLLEFYKYPAEHWVHLRTTNPRGCPEFRGTSVAVR